MPGRQDKSHIAAMLLRELREVSDAASVVLRAEIRHVYEDEGLSAGQLAERFGISKKRTPDRK